MESVVVGEALEWSGVCCRSGTRMEWSQLLEGWGLEWTGTGWCKFGAYNELESIATKNVILRNGGQLLVRLVSV